MIFLNLQTNTPIPLLRLDKLNHQKSGRVFIKKIKRRKGNLPVIISPLAYVCNHAKIAVGTIITHHAFINANSQIGKCGIIN